jgi:hypothetical protein
MIISQKVGNPHFRKYRNPQKRNFDFFSIPNEVENEGIAAKISDAGLDPLLSHDLIAFQEIHNIDDAIEVRANIYGVRNAADMK